MMKKGIHKKYLSLIIALVMVLSSAQMAFGCTGIYFGSETTENGSTFIGRSEDSSWKTYKKVYTVHDAEDHEEGSMYKSVSTGFEMPYPSHTYRYTLVKDATNYLTLEDEEMAQAGTNEMGVAVSGTVTLSGGKAEIVGNRRTGVTGVDPMVSGGLCEEDIPSVILMQASTAREGAQLLVDIYETYGAGGRDMTAIIDSKEAWIVQSLSGHVAVAVLCPDNMVGTSPNITSNVPLTDDGNTIASSNIYTVAEEAGTLVTDQDGNMLIADTYASASSSMSKRLYNCYLYLMGEEYANSAEEGWSQYTDYFMQPSEEKYSTYEVLQSLAYRGEGGKYYAAESTGNSIGIGNDNNLEVHMFESRKNMPEELSVIQWESLGPVEFGVYLPGYNALITDTIEENKIGTDTMTYNYDNPELNNYRTAYFELYFLCKGRDNQDGLTVGSAEAREKYGAGVRAFWEAYQKELIAQQPAIDAQMKKILAYDKSLAEQKATELNMHLQKEALGYIDQMVQELKEFESTAQEGNYVPSCMGALPTYSFDAIGGTGLPSDKPAASTVTAPTAGAGTAPAAAQPALKKATVKVKTVTAKANKTTKISVKKAFKVNSSKTSLKFKKVSGNKNITITKKGTIKVKKGLVKGKTYKLKVKVTAAEGKGYSKLSKTVTLKIKVK
ncbi:MAG: C69 family dipeptidase [Mogibacterium sp.]|nr:C69 family dipeptidase [Mogibacterium sp.]